MSVNSETSWLKTIAYQAPGVLGVIVIVWIFVAHLDGAAREATKALSEASKLFTETVKDIREIRDAQRDLRNCCDGPKK